MSEQSTPPTALDSPGSQSGESRIRVAVVEDDPGYLDLLRLLFSQTPGFAMAAAYGDVPSALAGLVEACADVLLMDINLPGLSGAEGVSRVAKIAPNLPIVMLTSFEDYDLVHASLRAGAVGYLLKRLPPLEILEAIHDVLAGGSPMSSPIARMVVRSFAASPETNPPKDPLSERERELLKHLAEGFRYKEIADRMDVSINTIRTYIRRVYEKLHVQSRTEAIRTYRKSQ